MSVMSWIISRHPVPGDSADAREPKKDTTLASTLAHPFPNTIDVSYTLVPNFIAAVDPQSSIDETANRDVQLPVTSIPSQVLEVKAAGIALSPYRHNAAYSRPPFASAISGWNFPSRSKIPTTPVSRAS